MVSCQYQPIAGGFNVPNSNTEQKNLIALGVITTAALREHCREAGVSAFGDFLNGAIMSGFALEDRMKGEGSFEREVERAVVDYATVQSSAAFAQSREALGASNIAEVIAERSSLSMIASVAIESKFAEVAEALSLSRQQMFTAIAYGIVGLVCCSPDSEIQENLRTVIWSVGERANFADMFAGLSDDDLFGDDDDDD